VEQFEPSTLTQKQFKEMKRKLQEEQKNRGPSGAQKLPATTPGIAELVAGIQRVAQEKNTNPVEVVHAILKSLKSPYHLVSKVQEKEE
jgi:hypothetical protein